MSRRRSRRHSPDEPDTEVKLCIVESCTSNSICNPFRLFFTLPDASAQPELLAKWLLFLQITALPENTCSYVCSEHFNVSLTALQIISLIIIIICVHLQIKKELKIVNNVHVVNDNVVPSKKPPKKWKPSTRLSQDSVANNVNAAKPDENPVPNTSEAKAIEIQSVQSKNKIISNDSGIKDYNVTKLAAEEKTAKNQSAQSDSKIISSDSELKDGNVAKLDSVSSSSSQEKATKMKSVKPNNKLISNDFELKDGNAAKPLVNPAGRSSSSEEKATKKKSVNLNNKIISNDSEMSDGNNVAKPAVDSVSISSSEAKATKNKYISVSFVYNLINLNISQLCVYGVR